MCEECYVNESRITPLLRPEECLQNHTQYICGTCGRCICIEKDPVRGLQRWNFPFRTAAIARLYLRTADYTEKKSCGIYELTDAEGRIFYKIFTSKEVLQLFLSKNKTKACTQMKPLFTVRPYREYPHTEVRKLTPDEIARYMQER